MTPNRRGSEPKASYGQARFELELRKFYNFSRAVWRYGWRIGLTLALAALLVLLSLNVYVVTATKNSRYEQITNLPHYRIGLVFGAGIRADGRPSRILADRIDGAVELYQAGQIDKLLLSGDNSSPDYDEVNVMRRYALTQGVALEDITLDYAGFSTYESCYRANAIFGVQEAVLITQRFHLSRALYTCQQLGINAVGLGIYSQYRTGWYTMREALATVKALWDLHISRPLPTFLGPAEFIH